MISLITWSTLLDTVVIFWDIAERSSSFFSGIYKAPSNFFCSRHFPKTGDCWLSSNRKGPKAFLVRQSLLAHQPLGFRKTYQPLLRYPQPANESRWIPNQLRGAILSVSWKSSGKLTPSLALPFSKISEIKRPPMPKG